MKINVITDPKPKSIQFDHLADGEMFIFENQSLESGVVWLKVDPNGYRNTEYPANTVNITTGTVFNTPPERLVRLVEGDLNVRLGDEARFE